MQESLQKNQYYHNNIFTTCELPMLALMNLEIQLINLDRSVSPRKSRHKKKNNSWLKITCSVKRSASIWMGWYMSDKPLQKNKFIHLGLYSIDMRT